MSLEPFFLWMSRLPISGYIRESAYLSPANNLLHLLSMVAFIGALAIVDLRLLNRGMTEQSVKQVARGAQPWLIGGFLGLLVTGFFALTASAMTQYTNRVFWLKMYILLAAIIFTVTVRRQVTMADEARVGPFWGKLVGLASIALWSSVAVAARLIMFLR
jgi:uncharacterized protein DUF6644